MVMIFGLPGYERTGGALRQFVLHLFRTPLDIRQQDSDISKRTQVTAIYFVAEYLVFRASR